jgi:hypothetical protein
MFTLDNAGSRKMKEGQAWRAIGCHASQDEAGEAAREKREIDLQSEGVCDFLAPFQLEI